MNGRSAFILLTAVLSAPLSAQTTFVIANQDGPGVGFNDPTPVSPVGGNTGTTLGQQRLIAVQYAAQLWAGRLQSRVPIKVKTTFTKLDCSATSAVLAQAGAAFLEADFAGASVPATWFPMALANAQAGVDLNPGYEQIGADFNSALDDGSCAFPGRWYYGLDRKPPSGTNELVTVAEHELGHGLGFQTFVDPTTGQRQPATDGTPMNDVFMLNLYDAARGKGWAQMTDSERAQSATDTGNLVWSGAAVTAKAPSALLSGIGPGGHVLMYAPRSLNAGSSVSHWDTSLSPNELLEPYYSTLAPPAYGMLVTGELMTDIGWPASAPAPIFTWLLPSSAHSGGAGGAFYTTALSVANRDAKGANVTLKFLGNNADGTSGPTVSRTIPAGQELTVPDILASLFGVTDGYGAIEITADTSLLNITSQTSTPAPGGGTFGQSVPGIPASSFIQQGAARSIVAVRQDTGFRTNLILANGSTSQTTVHGELYDGNGARVGSGRDWTLFPLGMTQIGKVVEDITSPGTILQNGRLVLSTPTSGGSFAAYAALIDNTTNDPRTLLPSPAAEPSMTWLLPSSAHAPGAGGAFYTTDLTIANTGAAAATLTLQFLGHDVNGTGGTRLVLPPLPAGDAEVFEDVLGRTFGVGTGYGAILVTSSSPALAISSQTWTPAPSGGTYGQSVPAFPVSSFVPHGSPRSAVPIREDAAFRTNLILASGTATSITVHGDLVSASGAVLASGDWVLPPFGMTQVGHVVNDLLGPTATLSDGQLVLSTSNVGGAFAAYLATIDNGTNDPRTILPQ